MRCVHEARQISIARGAQMDGVHIATPVSGDDDALRVKNWLPGSYGRYNMYDKCVSCAFEVYWWLLLGLY